MPSAVSRWWNAFPSSSPWCVTLCPLGGGFFTDPAGRTARYMTLPLHRGPAAPDPNSIVRTGDHMPSAPITTLARNVVVVIVVVSPSFVPDAPAHRAVTVAYPSSSPSSIDSTDVPRRSTPSGSSSARYRCSMCHTRYVTPSAPFGGPVSLTTVPSMPFRTILSIGTAVFRTLSAAAGERYSIARSPLGKTARDAPTGRSPVARSRTRTSRTPRRTRPTAVAMPTMPPPTMTASWSFVGGLIVVSAPQCRRRVKT
mmetsp:Transcript_25370/g.51875  ORF Transcript_25370/g.51875 Transcript_25370/m.51875 type:complete len:255 (+) Transcript_25370:673-1437(+)